MVACVSCGASNPDDARFCNACGERLPRVAVAEVRKTVSVVFCDVRGSTELGERLDPEALRRVMSKYFDAATVAIERHGGVVEKFIGDAVMAVFGIPMIHEDDALRAVRAADGIRDSLGWLNKELERDHGVRLECRIGVNTGEVVAGDATIRQALVTGAAVNVAARLEQAASPGEILLSESTVRLVRDAVVAEAVGPLEVKGKREPVSAHRLVAVHPEAPGIARRLDSPLVGRRRQLARLGEAFEDAVADRACHLLTIVGPPGVGKSRLLQEALESFEDATVLRGRCLSYGEGITYRPIAEIVHDALRLSGHDASRAWDSALSELLAGQTAAGDIASRLAELVGVGDDTPAPVAETAWAVRRFFESLATEHPLVVVIDDLQWAGEALLDLVDHVVDVSRDAPILIVCMARPELLEIRGHWGGGKLRVTTMMLEPLSAEESTTLVSNLLAGELDAAVRDRIVAAAGGNPLFIEETVRMLIDDGLLVGSGDGLTARADVDEISVPPSIQALLAARLDQLDEADRAVLGRASVAGQVFYLGAVASRDLRVERSDLDRLVRRDLIRPTPSDLPGEEAYAFRHALLRDAAYAMLPKETRADFHEDFADWLTAFDVPDVDEFVGYHLELAHAYRLELGAREERTRALADRAAERLSAAATRAGDRGLAEGAASLFRRAAALRPPGDPRRASDLVGAGWALLEWDRATEAGEVLAEALTAARDAGDVTGEGRAELGLLDVRAHIEPEGAMAVVASELDRLMPAFEERHDDRGLALAYLLRAQIHWGACRYADARDLCATAAEHARRAGYLSGERRALATMATAAALGPARVDAILRDLDRETGRFPSLRLHRMTHEAYALTLEGRVDDGIRLRQEAASGAVDLYGYVLPSGHEWTWRIHMLADRPAVAEEAIRQGYERTVASGDLMHASTFAGEWALACVRLGRFDDARRLSAECRTTSATDDVINQMLWRRVDARLAAIEDDLDRAIDLIKGAVEAAERTDMLVDTAQTYLEAADVYALAGRREDARAAASRARELAARKGASLVVGLAERRLSELEHA